MAERTDAIRSLTIAVLADDVAGSGGFQAEHGLSFWIDADGFRLLFDSGQGEALWRNARLLGIELRNVDAVAISHGHYDHTGGLARLVSECRKAVFYLHPGAAATRFSRSADGSTRSIGIPPRAAELIAERGEVFRWTRTMTRLHPRIFVTGEIQRAAPPEAPTNRFYLDRECLSPDSVIDDQALGIETDEGTVAILGCSHAGVENTLSSVLSHSRAGKLRALFGGMHLAEAPLAGLERLADRLEELSPRMIGPGHCTGRCANVYLKNRFSDACTVIRAGMVFKSHEHF